MSNHAGESLQEVSIVRTDTGKFTIPRQFQSGEHMTPSAINSDGIKILEPFYKKLEEEVFAELRKNFGDWTIAPTS
jgi:hypothetical protein